MDELTDADLSLMLARATASLPGPWWSSWEGRDHWSGDAFIGTGVDGHRGLDIYVSTDEGPAGVELQDFIAAARQDVPALVAEVRRLRSLQT